MEASSGHALTPRSYVVEIPDGTYRRNRKHLQLVPPKLDFDSDDTEHSVEVTTPRLSQSPIKAPPVTVTSAPEINSPETTDPNVTITKSGRASVRPMRYRD